jgi:serine/threonine protein kinase
VLGTTLTKTPGVIELSARWDMVLRMFKIRPCFDDVDNLSEVYDPEVSRNAVYSTAVDMFSMGAVTSYLVSGTNPNEYRNHEEDLQAFVANQRENIENLPTIFETEPWRRVPEHTKSFVSQLLVNEPTSRLSVIDALKHPWIVGNDGGSFLEAIYHRAIGGWSSKRGDKFAPKAVFGRPEYRLNAADGQYAFRKVQPR